MSSSDDDERLSSRHRFDGKKPEQWDRFEKHVLRALSKHVGRELAEKMWWNQVPDVSDTEAMDDNDLRDHCKLVLNKIRDKSESRAAKYEAKTHIFWKREWQANWIANRFEDLYDIVEKSVSGQAEVVLDGIERRDAHRLREVLFKQFGGSAEDVRARERRFEAGMPATAGAAAFPPGCDMPVKLRQLETEKRHLYRICPLGQRADYKYGKETTLVSIVLELLHGTEYEDTCKGVIRDVRLQLQMKACMPKQTEKGEWVQAEVDPTVGFDDWDLRNFSTEWQPSWERLEAALVSAYKEKTYRSTYSKSTSRLPGDRTATAVMFNPGYGQRHGEPAGKGVRCFGCGEHGHRMNDPECKAAKGTVHESAPQRIKEAVLGREVGKNGGAKNGKGKKQICHFFAKHGRCKFGEKCKYLHESGGKGGKKGSSMILSKKQTNKIASVMLTKLKARVAQEKKKRKSSGGSSGNVTKKQAFEDDDNEGSNDESWLSAFMFVKTVHREHREVLPVDVTSLASHPLHDLRDLVIDSASAASISTNRDDFLMLDTGNEAKGSVTINGPSTGKPQCGGRGPMLMGVRHPSRKLAVCDPEGVYPEPGTCPDLRILSAQIMSKKGLSSSTGVYGQGSHMECAQSGESLKLKTANNILVMRTSFKASDVEVTPKLLEVIREIQLGNRSPLIDLDDLEWNAEREHKPEKKGAWASVGKKSCGALLLTLMAITCLMNPMSIMLNESKLKVDEKSRLWCRRFGFCDTNLFPKMNSMPEYGNFPELRALNEDVKGRNLAKFKKKAHTRNAAEITMDSPPWWRVYVDGYGGQGSLGGTSLEGAAGGYLFVCPSTGAEDLRLYASHDQFPVALSQFLRRVQGEYYTTHVIYCDTFSCNISEDAEFVAAAYNVNILPVSAGSPQEMAFVETRVRLLKRHSTAQMQGAPHLPASFWALSDKYAVYVRQFLPQATRDFHCSFYLRTGRVIDWSILFIKNFGAVVHYVPGEGPIHKRGAVVKSGVFVGVQYPAVLVYREEEPKMVISVSMTKVFVYESQYLQELDEMVEKGSIKDELKLRVLQSLPTPESIPENLSRPAPAETAAPQRSTDDRGSVLHERRELSGSGEEGNAEASVLPEVRTAARSTLTDDEIQRTRDESTLGKRKGFAACMSERDMPQLDLRQVQSIKTLREHRFQQNPAGKPTTVLDQSANDGHLGNVEGEEGEYISDIHSSKINSALADIERAKKLLEKSIPQVTLRKQVVKKIAQITAMIENPAVQEGALKVGKKSKTSVSEDNVIDGKRKKPQRTAAEKYLEEAKVRNQKKKEAIPERKKKVAKGDLVSCKATLFDGDDPGSYSDGRPERCYGVATTGVKKGVVTVRWKDDDEVVKVLAKDLRVEYEKNTDDKIVALLVEGKQIAFTHAGKQDWPKNFFELIIKDDWREWVKAVKRELEGWNDNNAVTLVNIEDVPSDAKIVPLGELYTIKRDGRYKFRQYLMGNLLREGIDYGETFSTTISMPGVCIFYSLATTCRKPVWGWDAVCGYLQVKEQYDSYAFLPSHQLYSDLSYEELAEFRKELLKLAEQDGIEGIKKFAAKMKKDSRVNPKEVLKLNSAIYGGPSAGHDFEMLMHATHTQTCGCTQTQPEPSMFVRIIVEKKDGSKGECRASEYGAAGENNDGVVYGEEDDVVVGYLLAIVWTDDVRFFGTEPEVEKYIMDVKSRIKMEIERPPVTEFVGIETHQDFEYDTCELKMPKYWKKALNAFTDLFPGGPRVRKVPLSVADEKVLLAKPSEAEMKEAKGLPYLEVLGTISYSAASCKPEMRYFVSVAGSNRSGWSTKQFEILLKGFEYGYYTREMGLIFSKGLDPHGENVLYAYADSSHSVPRSQGCRIVMMNGACVSCRSKKHSLSAPSTCVDELIEFYECTVDVAGLRNVMAELGMYQKDPSRVYQDNKSAIQIANNRGSLGVTSRAIDLKTLSARNRIEDMQVETKYCPTPIMRADIGTKALPEDPFVSHRDITNGYALVRSAYPEKKMPEYVHVGNELTHNANLSALCVRIMNAPCVGCDEM